MSRFQRILDLGVFTFVSPFLLLGLWELFSVAEIIDVRFFSRPSDVADTFVSMATSGELVDHLKISLQRIGIGFIVGALPGIALGALLGFSGVVRALLGPAIALTYPLPKLALLPLILLVLGTGEESKVAVVALGVFYIVLYNTWGGVQNLPNNYRDVSRSYGASRLQHIQIVALPGALPHIFVGLKLALGVALLLIVAAEFVGAKTGIGYLIWSSWEVFQVERMFVGLICLSALGFLLTLAMDAAERRLFPWRD